MFPKFVQVSLYSGGGRIYREGTYIWDVDWVSYFGGVYSEGPYIRGDGGRINGILNYLSVRVLISSSK